MDFHFISQQVKIAAIKLFERNLLPLEVILDVCDFSEHTWYHISKLWHEMGDVVNPKPTLCGHICLLDVDDLQYLLRLVRQNPDYFLDELLHLLKTNRFISVHYVTIHWELEHAGVSYKKLKHIAKERNENLYVNFIPCMAQYAPEELGFLDKTSKDNCTSSRCCGRSRKGKCAEKKQPFT
jgi:hypothetical protein